VDMGSTATLGSGQPARLGRSTGFGDERSRGTDVTSDHTGEPLGPAARLGSVDDRRPARGPRRTDPGGRQSHRAVLL